MDARDAIQIEYRRLNLIVDEIEGTQGRISEIHCSAIASLAHVRDLMLGRIEPKDLDWPDGEDPEVLVDAIPERNCFRD